MTEHTFKSQIKIGQRVVVCPGTEKILATVVSILFTGAGHYELCCTWMIEGHRIKDWFYPSELRPVEEKDNAFGFTGGGGE